MRGNVEKADETRRVKPSQRRFLRHDADSPGEKSRQGRYQVIQLCSPLGLCPGRERA
ncbi:hypothetical protein ACFSL4_05975 [Streptomyces caeni]|uniref:Uncharacterized protein n=1 Tax=Streptomyces caeni TaxID=2307231 RepID=A0ABW4IKE6_9ACTN